MSPTEKRLCVLKVARQQEVTQLNRGGRGVRENKLTVNFWNWILTPLNLRKDHTHLLKTGGIELSFVYDFHRHLIESVESSVRTSARKSPEAEGTHQLWSAFIQITISHHQETIHHGALRLQRAAPVVSAHTRKPSFHLGPPSSLSSALSVSQTPCSLTLADTGIQKQKRQQKV